jgi:hypothetical protein
MQEERRMQHRFEEEQEEGEHEDDLYEWEADEWEGAQMEGDVPPPPEEEEEAQVAEAGVALYDEGVEAEGLEQRGRRAWGTWGASDGREGQ